MFEQKKGAGTVRGQHLESGGADADGVMLAEAVLSGTNGLTTGLAGALTNGPIRARGKAARAPPRKSRRSRLGNSVMRFVLREFEKVRRSAGILTSFKPEKRIIELAGEPGDRWLRLRVAA